MAYVGRLLDTFINNTVYRNIEISGGGGTAVTIDLIYNNKLYMANVGKSLDLFIHNTVYRNIRRGGGGGGYCHYRLDLQQQTLHGKCW